MGDNMTKEDLKIRLEQYKSTIVEKAIENFNNMSLEERINYINELIETSIEDYRKWLYILKIMSIKTIQINKLKKFYENLDDYGKKEFQTELYETINNCEWDWQWDDNIHESDKLLKPFYNLDTIDSKLEEIRKKSITKAQQDNQEYHKKSSNIVDRCSEKVVEEFKKSIEAYVLLMENNLSDSTRKKLFSLPSHMRVYAFIEMYNTAEFWDFEDGYLINKYNYRQMIRDRKKQQLNLQEDIVKNSKGYVKRKYPMIKPRYKK